MDDDFFYDKLEMFDYWVDKMNHDTIYRATITKIEEDELTKFSSEPRIKIYTRR